MRLLFLLAVILCLPASVLEAEPPAGAFAYFVGSWHCDGVFPASGKTLSSNIRFEFDEASGALLKHHDDVAPGMYHALEMWGPVRSGGFASTVFDPYSGVRQFNSQGSDGDAVVWTRGGTVGGERFAYTRLTQEKMRIDWSVSKDGAPFSSVTR